MSYALRACPFGVRANNLQPREKRCIIVFSTVDTVEQGVCPAECIEASADDYANGAEVMTRLCRDLNPISATKKKSRVSGFFFLYSSLFTLHLSIFAYPTRLFQRRDKREEIKEKVAFLSHLRCLGRKVLIFIKKCAIIFSK